MKRILEYFKNRWKYHLQEGDIVVFNTDSAATYGYSKETIVKIKTNIPRAPTQKE